MTSVKNIVRPERIEELESLYKNIKKIHDSMDQTEEYNSITLLYLSRSMRLIDDAIFEAKAELKNF